MEHICPRRLYETQAQDTWRTNNTCSYCGSLNADEFMERVEAGTIKVGPTDKNYKVYVENLGGEPLSAIKFYFQHLSVEQKKRFVDLYNEQRVILGDPGVFYVNPFFMGFGKRKHDV